MLRLESVTKSCCETGLTWSDEVTVGVLCEEYAKYKTPTVASASSMLSVLYFLKKSIQILVEPVRADLEGVGV